MQARRQFIGYGIEQNIYPFPDQTKPITFQEKSITVMDYLKPPRMLWWKLSRKLEKMETKISFIPVAMKVDYKKKKKDEKL